MTRKKNKQQQNTVAHHNQQKNQNDFGGAKKNQGKSHKRLQQVEQHKKKEKEFIDNFEERQKENPAAVLLKEDRQAQQQPEKSWNDAKHKKKYSDGNDVVHVPVKQLLSTYLNDSYQTKKKKAGKKRQFLDSSDSTTAADDLANEYGEESPYGNVFESIIAAEETNKEKPERKRKRLNSDSSGMLDDDEKHGSTFVINGKKQKVNGKTDNISDDDDEDEDSISVSDEDDDLEEMALNDEQVLEDEDQEEDEDYDSFMTDEEEDESVTDEDEQEEEEDDYSTASTIDLQILGYTATEESANSLVLKAEEGYSIATSPFYLHKFSASLDDHSVQVGLTALQWILSPIDSQCFFSDIFQKRVLVVKRSASTYFEGIFSTQMFTQMLQNNLLEYGTDLNIASYEKGVRHTHNPTEKSKRVSPTEIREHLSKGHSIQCVHPQVFNGNIWYICEILQEVFCSFVGANNYLTPAGSAGFAPHWDDIDAFMLQIEGKKYWKIYAPENSDDALPLESSANFTDSDFNERKPVFEGWLEQGDSLYVPRGFIHQAHTSSDTHSHHLTISVCRRHSYANFFERASEEFINMLTEKSKRLRAALPPLLLDMGGAANLNYTGNESLDKKLLPISNIFARKFGTDFSSFVPSFIDLMAREFFKNALPPFLSDEERKLSCIGGTDFNLLAGHLEFDENTEVRLIRKHAQRLLIEDEEKSFIVHRMNNSRRYEGHMEESIFDFPIEFEDGFIVLADSYPEWTKVADLGLSSMELNISLADLLFKNGILLRKDESTASNGKINKLGNGGQKTKKKKGPKEGKAADGGEERNKLMNGIGSNGENKKKKRNKKKKAGNRNSDQSQE